jgi:hypothetical protein
MTPAARGALALALGSLVLYQANVREISSQDTLPNRVLPHELLRHGRLDLDRLFRDWPADVPLPFSVQRVGPHVVSSYPVAPAILAVPVYFVPVLLGSGSDWVVLNALSKLAASLFAALSVAFVYLAARELAGRMGASPASALGAAIVYAVATPTWAVSSQGLWGHAPAQLGLALALWALLRTEARPRLFALAGLGTGIMVASRPSTVLVAVALAVQGFRCWRTGGLGLLVVLGAVGGAVAAHNLATFGSLQGGYAELHRTHAQFHSVPGAWNPLPLGGLPGVLVSPSRGLFVYAPVLLFAAGGLVVGGRQRGGGPLLSAAAAVGAGIATVAQFAVWWGGHSFGPRLLADVLPALALGLVPVWDRTWRSAPRRALFVAAFAGSVLVEAVGAFFYPSPRHVDWNTSPADVDAAHERLWDWRDPQLLRLVRNGPASPGFRTGP